MGYGIQKVRLNRLIEPLNLRLLPALEAIAKRCYVVIVGMLDL